MQQGPQGNQQDNVGRQRTTQNGTEQTKKPTIPTEVLASSNRNSTNRGLSKGKKKARVQAAMLLESRREKFVKKLSKINQKFRREKGLEKDIIHTTFAEGESLEVFPNEIIFKDVVPGQIYQMKVTVKNKTRVVRRIRVFQPKSPEFRCDYEMVAAIAPGLTIDLIVSFEATSEGEFRDEIKIISGKYHQTVPMYAYSPMPKIIFEPFINMGFIQVGGKKTEDVVFKNEGTVAGRISLNTGEFKNLTIEPNSFFVLQPGQVHIAQLTYSATESGLFRGMVNVETNGKTFLQSIDINVTCVEYSQFVIDKNGNEMNAIEFGEVLFGQAKKIQGFLVNNSPESLFFKVNFMQGHFDMYEEENNIMSPHEVGHEQTMRILSMEPKAGYIQSYSQIPVVFTCKTDIEEDHLIWTKNNCLAKGDLVSKIIQKDYLYSLVYFFSKKEKGTAEESLTKVIKMNATGTCPQIHFSENTVNFMQCPVGQSMEHKFRITNDSACSVYIECPNLSSFHVKPRKLRLPSGESRTVVIKFTPRNLGDSTIKTHFVVNGKYECNVTLSGFGIPDPSNQVKVKTKSVRGLLRTRSTVGSGLSVRDKKKVYLDSKGKIKRDQVVLGRKGRPGMAKSSSNIGLGVVKLPSLKGNFVSGSAQNMADFNPYKANAAGFKRKSSQKKLLMSNTATNLRSSSKRRLGTTNDKKHKRGASQHQRENFSSQNATRPTQNPKKIDYLRESRINRLKIKRVKNLKKKMAELEGQIQERMPNYFNDTKNAKSKISESMTATSPMNQPNLALTLNSNIPNNDKSRPDEIQLNDVKFLFNPNFDGLDSPKLKQPAEDKYLYVTKPVGKYEPLESNITQLFDPDPNLERHPLPERPEVHNITRDINKRLDGEALKHIHAGPKIIDYDELFVNSTSNKYFSVRNSLRDAIVVRLVLDDPCILSSYEKPQVLLSGQTASFRVTFKSGDVGYVSKVIKYLINEKHEFKFMIKASVVKVNLHLSKMKVDITFNDDNLSMETYETLYLANKGNARASFRWFSPLESFSFVPEMGVVEPETALPVRVYYRPKGLKLFEEQTTNLLIEDGEDLAIQVTGSVQESRCEVEPKTLDFGSLAVGESHEVILTLNNTHARNSTIFFIDEEKVPENLKLNKHNGRIYPQSSDKIVVTFRSNEARQFSGEFFTILIRGNKALKVHFTAEVIIPKIVVFEPMFNFGKVTFGNSSEVHMQIQNTSPILAKLKLDLRGSTHDAKSDGAECLKVEQVKNSDEESLIMEEVDHNYLQMMERKNNNDKKPVQRAPVARQSNVYDPESRGLNSSRVDIDNDSMFSRDTNEEGSAEIILDQDEKEVNYFVLTLKPNKVYKFKMTMTPSTTKSYKFLLPLFLGNSLEFNPDLQKPVICESVPPKILMEPIDGVRDFKKMIITHLKGNSPMKKILKITNPDRVNSLNFFINADALEEDRVFSLSKSEGTILPQMSLDVVVIFKPHIPGAWNYTLPLYLDDDRENKKSEIIIKGEAAYPKIFFDRRQVILPVVPLNIESRCVFRVINEGFQNVTLKMKPLEEYQKSIISLNINFIDGISMNLRKRVMKIEVTFKSKKAISFTTKLEFEDDHDGIWSIYCSGTTDNSILSNIFYFMRNPDEEGEIMREGSGPIEFQIPEPAEEEESNGAQGAPVKSTAEISKMSFNMATGNLGYSPVPMEGLIKHCQTLSFWLSETIPAIGVSEFPDSIIMENGKQLLTSLNFLTRKNYGSLPKFKLDEKQSEKVPKLFEVYEKVIGQLKEQGGLLNHIRPEFLMDYSDLIFYLKTNPVENAHSVSLKLNESQFRYLSMYSWASLFNQIIKMFYLARINMNKFRQMKGLSEEQTTIERNFLTKSNVYSPSEIILLKWAGAALEIVKKQSRYLMLFDKHFQNGLALACVLHHFSDNSVRPLIKMKEIILSENDVYDNMTAVKEAIQELGVTCVPTINEMVNLTTTHSVLLLANLFQVMPSYLPKETVDFECVLNETIVKKVILSNPTNYKISYHAVKTGSPDFKIEEPYITINQKSRFEFPIKFFARLTRPVQARLCFKSTSEGGNQAMPVVYNLRSKVNKRRSVDRMEISDSKLYDVKNKELMVSNPFDHDVEFRVTVEYLKSVKQKRMFGGMERSNTTERNNTNQNNRSEIRNRNQSGRMTSRAEDEVVFPSFFLLTDRIFIKKKKRAKIKFLYIPLTFEIHMCHFILTDNNVGEIQYDVVGTPKLPDPLQVFNIQTNLDDNNFHNLFMSMKYQSKIEAYTKVESLIRRIPDERTKHHMRSFLEKSKEAENFKLELANGGREISLPSDFKLYHPEALAEAKKEIQNPATKEELNVLKVGLNFRSPVNNFSCMFMMRNRDYSDVRVFELVVTVLPRIFKAEMKFQTAARIPISQMIPVANATDSDITFEVIRRDGAYGQFFKFSSLIAVKRESINELEVVFLPEWTQLSKTNLIISNPATQEKFEYLLTGKGTEPLAEDHLVFKCDVGECGDRVIEVKNTSKEKRRYKVNYDLHGVEAKKEFGLNPGSKTEYHIKVTPSLGGIYAGSLTITDDRGYFWWYSMELESKGMRNMREYEVTSMVRKEAVCEIPVENKFEEDIEFNVIIRGNEIYGAMRMKLPPLSKQMYRLTYLPLEVKTSSENSVCFTNAKAGEIFCRIKTSSHEAKAEKLPIFKAEIGKSSFKELKLVNPSNKRAKVSTLCTNSENFEVIPPQFEIAPYSSFKPRVKYIPNEIDVQNSSDLLFKSDCIGSWKYIMFGEGKNPTEYEERKIVAMLKKEGSTVVTFTNPFKTPIILNVDLKKERKRIFSKKATSGGEASPIHSSPFTLLFNKSRISLAPGKTLSVPISFFPQEVNEYKCKLFLRLNEKIAWIYPIRLVTEAMMGPGELSLTTVCRKKKEKTFRIELPGLRNIDDDDEFDIQLIELKRKPERLRVIRKWFQVMEGQTEADPETNTVSFVVKFHPHKPLKEVGVLKIRRKKGGIWRSV